LVAVHSRTKERAAAFAQAHGGKPYDDYFALLADPRVDAVYIASEPHRHPEQAIAAARAGKHAIVERPMATTVAGCHRMIQAARSAGTHLAIAHVLRFHPKTIKLKQLLSESAVGLVVCGRVLHTRLYNPQPDEPGYWRVVASRSGGGPTQDEGSDRLDALCFLLGAPREVTAYCSTTTMPYDVEDSMAMLVRFATGAQISCHFQWNIPVARDNFELFGTEGAIISTPFSGNDLILCTSGGDIRHEFRPPANAHLPLIADFVQRLLAGEPPACPADETLATYQIINAAYESARTRQSVKIEAEPEATL